MSDVALNTSNASATFPVRSSFNVEGQLEGRKTSQLPSTDVPSQWQKMIGNAARKFCSVAEFIGVIAGGFAATAFSIVTCGVGLAVWNGMNDEKNDLFSVCMKRGGEIGLAIARFMTCTSD